MGLERARRAAGPDGPDPQDASATRKGSVGERMQALGQGPTLQIQRGRQGPRRDHGLHPGTAGQSSAPSCRALFNTLVPGNLEVQRLSARGGTRRARRLWRRRLDRRHDPGQVLDQPPHHRPAQQVRACPTSLHHEAIPGHVWQGEYAQQAAADPDAARLQCLFRRLGALRGAAGRRARRLRRFPGRPPRLSPVDRLPRAAAWSSTPASTRSAGPASRASTSSSTERLKPEEVAQRGRPLLQLARPGLRLQGRPQRDQPPA